MAEQVIRVCDVCGAPATETVTLKVEGKTYQKDLCAEHLESLTQGARAARRGRPRGTSPASTGSQSVGARKAKTTTAAPKRRGRRPKAGAAKRASAKRSVAKRERKRITDPVVLAKRRAALAKARQALAAKRSDARKAG
jgi:hypothetical protein